MASRAQNITIHDVAAKAGVSIKTVSRVLRKEPDVAAATREKVQEAIARVTSTVGAATAGTEPTAKSR